MPLQYDMVQQLEKALNDNPKKPYGLVVIDIIGYHDLVRDYGFKETSKLTDRLMSRIESLKKISATTYSVGDSTFALTLDEEGDSAEIAECFLDYLSRPYLVNGLLVNILTSVGVAIDPTSSLSTFELLDNACTAAHEAERQGFKRVYTFEPEMEKHRVRARKIRSDLSKAVSQISPHADDLFHTSSFEVVYQPKVNLSNRELLGFEALLRWKHPIYGPICPEVFVPLCEETGLINVVGAWVIRVACHDASQWPKSPNGKKLTVAVNLSPSQLSDKSLLLNSVTSAFEEFNMNPRDMEFELTEREFEDAFLDVVDELKSIGCAISIDDFGVKYSSLGRLKKIPFDYIKIDRSFVKDIGAQTPQPYRDRALWLLRNIAMLGQNLRVRVVAEGVETEEQATLALGAGCNIMQGYLVSPPLKREYINPFITNYTVDNGS